MYYRFSSFLQQWIIFHVPAKTSDISHITKHEQTVGLPQLAMQWEQVELTTLEWHCRTLQQIACMNDNITNEIIPLHRYRCRYRYGNDITVYRVRPGPLQGLLGPWTSSRRQIPFHTSITTKKKYKFYVLNYLMAILAIELLLSSFFFYFYRIGQVYDCALKQRKKQWTSR